MKGRELLVKALDKCIKSEVNQDSIIMQRQKSLKSFGLSKTFVNNYLHIKENIAAADDLTLYFFTLVYLPGEVTKYFLPDEILQYKNAKFKKESMDGTITIHALRITDNQWIGRISSKELMLWRNAQIINYNENAQRAMKHIISRGKDYYQISLNQKAVDAIADSLTRQSYIPNTLTFNVPEEVEINYDEDSALLSFDLNGNSLDILDGYHRYIALSKVVAQNPDYENTFEIRIVQFSTHTAQQFIWQEDQKTKMTKLQSNAMNQNKLSNQITQRVNESPNCDFYNNITANGIINKGYFSAMVNQMYCKRVSKEKELLVQKKATSELVDYLNWLAEEEPSFLSKAWDKRIIYATVYLAAKGIKNIKTVRKIHKEVYSDENMKYLFKRTDITASDIKRLDKMVKGGK